MYPPSKISVILVIIASVGVMTAGKHLREKPAFLTPCLLKDPAFSKCFTKNFQALLTEWKNGVPGLKSVGGLDPLYVKRVTIDHDQSPIAINANLLNIEITGLGDVRVSDAVIDTDTLTATAILTVPRIVMKCDYKLKGKILSLAINGNGRLELNADNFVAHIQMHQKLRHEGGFTFTDIEKLRLDIKDISGFHIQLYNLFNGQKDLEDSANALFNESWYELYLVLKPAIRSAVETVLSDRISKVFAYTPAEFLIADIHSA